MQGLLEVAGIPYVGAGVLGSAVGMDKDVMKRLLRDADIPITHFITVRRSRFDAHAAEVCREAAKLGFPLFTKPANAGSSVGVRKVKSAADLEDAIRFAFRFDVKVVVEAGVDGARDRVRGAGWRSGDGVRRRRDRRRACRWLLFVRREVPRREGCAARASGEALGRRAAARTGDGTADVRGARVRRARSRRPVPDERRRAARERDQHAARVHGDLDVSEAVGIVGPDADRADQPADRSRHARADERKAIRRNFGA